ncbi:MAG: hypothetical protein WA751_04040 [Candidatus Dormiibacterota bacterium]
MAEGRVLLVAEVSSEALPAVEFALRELLDGAIVHSQLGLHVEASVADGNPQDLNRQLLSALRRVERRTRLRAEWTRDRTTYRFFDYVLKGSSPAIGSTNLTPG